jgi:hypothetical protein
VPVHGDGPQTEAELSQDGASPRKAGMEAASTWRPEENPLMARDVAPLRRTQPTVKLSPQPHSPVALGLWNTKLALRP